jgi:hypothetical protein
MRECMYRSAFSWPRHYLECSASRSCRFTPLKRIHGVHCIGGWVDLRTGVDGIDKWRLFTLSGLELRSLRSPPVASRYTDWVKSVHSSTAGVRYLIVTTIFLRSWFQPWQGPLKYLWGLAWFDSRQRQDLSFRSFSNVSVRKLSSLEPRQRHCS